MKVYQTITPHLGHACMTQDNYHYNQEIVFIPWYYDDECHNDGTVAVWRLKELKPRDPKPADWEAMDYPNNINA